MSVIAYQSFNANSATDHGIKNLSSQRFTKDTNAHVTGQNDQALVLPYSTENVSLPYQGPAHLKPIEKLTEPQASHVFGAQIALLWQNFYRVFGAMPDIMVCGELDTSHKDFANVVSGPDITATPVPATRACQSFTAISQTVLASQLNLLASGEGFVAYQVSEMVVVFVHVPNRVAAKSDLTQEFYSGIAGVMKGKGKVIHLVIGDTNQPSLNYTSGALNAAFGTDKYKNATGTATISKVDNYGVVATGTNSNSSKMYDVAVYRSDLVKLLGSTVYVSQSSSGVTITDHCGLAVNVQMKKVD